MYQCFKKEVILEGKQPELSMIYFFIFYFLNVKFTLIEYRGLEIIEKEKNPMSHSPEITF